ncbi:hypothetical protein G9A89_010912 [Geosiphon pyriformis]|nr:hypothetical protein G9A89_010912 [Geosiphon pyriformis]
MSGRKRIKASSTQKTEPSVTLNTTKSDKIVLYFSREIKFPVHKSRIAYENLATFIEERLRFVHTFNYPYEIFYDDREGIEHEIHSEKVNAVQKIKEVLEGEEGEFIEGFYFIADKSGGIKTWVYYNVDFLAFLATIICVIGVIFSTRFELKIALYITGAFLMTRMVKHVDLPGIPRDRQTRDSLFKNQFKMIQKFLPTLRSNLNYPKWRPSCMIIKRFLATKEPLSPLVEDLKNRIKKTGPISIAHYMKEVSTNPLRGYYMRGDVFGEKGDFITSPEISQMFGELVGIWFFMQWQNLGAPKNIQIVELGPGRGTLMEDMLRALRNFGDCFHAIRSIHLIEASRELCDIQRRKLCDDLQDSQDKNSTKFARNKDGLEFYWHEVFDDVPDICSMVIAHEFFDAIPIYVFERTKNGYQEIMVDVDEDNTSPFHFRLVIHPLTRELESFLHLPLYEKVNIGDRIEVSPESWHIANQISKHIQKNSGSSLIIDYGQDFVQSDTFRAIKKHKFVNVMSTPGEADVSANVNFKLLKNASQHLADVHGPITQADFLHQLGIGYRLKMLLNNSLPTMHQNLMSGYQRLTDPLAMGRIYKVLALTPQGSPVPVAFESNSHT